MSEASAGRVTLYTERPHHSPCSISADLYPTLEKLGLLGSVSHLKDEGYAVLNRVLSEDKIAALRAYLLDAIASSTTSQLRHERSLRFLLGKHPMFAELVTHPTLLALVEYSCGKGALLSNLLATSRAQGCPGASLHSDLAMWLPEPFPEYSCCLTFCLPLESLNAEKGATKVVPRTHRLRRLPSAHEAAAEEHAIPIELSVGSIACWDGHVWHGSYERKVPGERLMLHIQYVRMALRTAQDWRHITTEYLSSQPYSLRVLLGREDLYGVADGVEYEPQHVMNTMNWVKS